MMTPTSLKKKRRNEGRKGKRQRIGPRRKSRRKPRCKPRAQQSDPYRDYRFGNVGIVHD
jgi:hypothetical protein